LGISRPDQTLATYPAADVVGGKTDDRSVTAVSVRCCFCGGVHEHTWFGESDGLREASCTPYSAIYRITVGTREKIEAMRTENAHFSKSRCGVSTIRLCSIGVPARCATHQCGSRFPG
jgi:hypothetical protein